jgi:hypothetical protein
LVWDNNKFIIFVQNSWYLCNISANNRKNGEKTKIGFISSEQLLAYLGRTPINSLLYNIGVNPINLSIIILAFPNPYICHP